MNEVVILITEGKNCSLWGYARCITVDPGTDDINIIVIGEASSRELFLRVASFGKKLSDAK